MGRAVEQVEFYTLLAKEQCGYVLGKVAETVLLGFFPSEMKISIVELN